MGPTVLILRDDICLFIEPEQKRMDLSAPTPGLVTLLLLLEFSRLRLGGNEEKLTDEREEKKKSREKKSKKKSSDSRKRSGKPNKNL